LKVKLKKKVIPWSDIASLNLKREGRMRNGYVVGTARIYLTIPKSNEKTIRIYLGFEEPYGFHQIRLNFYEFMAKR